MTDRFLTEHEAITLEHISKQSTAAENFAVAFETNDAITSCLNGGPTRGQAMVVLEMLTGLLKAGQLSRPGIEAVRPIVGKLEAVKDEDRQSLDGE